jgi:hypothetical protein
MCLCGPTQSSEHTILELNPKNIDNGKEKDFLYSAVEDIISFNLNYFGLLSCMTSPYVKKVFNGS